MGEVKLLRSNQHRSRPGSSEHRGISYLAAGCGGSAFFDRSTFFDVDACSRKDLFGFEMADFVVRLFEKLSV
jgi:hypothetical protein